ESSATQASIARACPKNSTSATLSCTLSPDFVENGRNSTKCFDKVGDKMWKSRLVRHALASKKHRRTEKSFCMGATPLMLFAGSDEAQELLELPHHNLEGVEPG